MEYRRLFWLWRWSQAVMCGKDAEGLGFKPIWVWGKRSEKNQKQFNYKPWKMVHRNNHLRNYSAWRHYSLGNSFEKKNLALISYEKLKMNQQCFKTASTSPETGTGEVGKMRKIIVLLHAVLTISFLCHCISFWAPYLKGKVGQGMKHHLEHGRAMVENVT